MITRRFNYQINLSEEMYSLINDIAKENKFEPSAENYLEDRFNELLGGIIHIMNFDNEEDCYGHFKDYGIICLEAIGE